MSKQDGIEVTTKKRRSRKTSTANQQNGKQAPAAQRPAYDDIEAWIAYWKEQGQPWRTEPEIDEERQKYLAGRRDITPDIKKGIYPFKDIKLNRADVEWLLVTHENGLGPVDWNDESQRERMGIDLRGAYLKGINLSGLPLARLHGMLVHGDKWNFTTRIERRLAIVHLEEADLRDTHLEGAILIWANLKRTLFDRAHLEQADLTGADLERAELQKVYAEGADFRIANLEGAFIYDAHMEGAIFITANMKKARLGGVHLEGANLYQAHLNGADLRGAHLEGAQLGRAHLEGAPLIEAHLEGKEMLSDDFERVRKWKEDFPAILQPADLREAFFDAGTILDDATFGEEKFGFVLLADVHWGDVNLSKLDLTELKMRGEDYKPRYLEMLEGETRNINERLNGYLCAVRASRQLAVALQLQGLNEDAARYAYRAQVLQKSALWLQMTQRGLTIRQRMQKSGAWLFSWFLFLLAGYGYRPVRSIVAYLFIIFSFMGLYLLNAHFVTPHLRWDEALVLSVSSFHGRGFFSQDISLGDTYARLATLEAVLGLFIEISFIATFTQRFFGK